MIPVIPNSVFEFMMHLMCYCYIACVLPLLYIVCKSDECHCSRLPCDSALRLTCATRLHNYRGVAS